MWTAVVRSTQWLGDELLAASVVSSGYAPASAERGLSEMIGIGLLGGLAGLVGGLVLTQIVRWVSVITGRNLGGAGWVVGGTVAGALLFSILALRGGLD